MPAIQKLMARWWDGRVAERFWIEVTDRPDIGLNLKAPISNEQGDEFWSYSLVREVRPGDTVFHYDKGAQAIVGWSQATGKAWADKITWAARGTAAREAGIKPHERDGVYLGLESYHPISPPVSLQDIRRLGEELEARIQQLEHEVGSPLYYPFERSSKRPTRPLQGYLFKLPKTFVDAFAQLGPSSATARDADFGTDYRAPDEDQAVAEQDPFAVDPSLVERGLRGHASTQNRLAEAVREAGVEPRSPGRDEPNYDLAWKVGATMWVAEVKSVTKANEEKQLRLGLGQVLRYAHLLARKGAHVVIPVLVTEARPTDMTWNELCVRLGVKLMYPPFSQWTDLLDTRAEEPDNKSLKPTPPLRSGAA